MYVTDAVDADAVAAVHGEIFKHVRPAATLVLGIVLSGELIYRDILRRERRL